jgi:hypothetical protein
MGFDVPGHRVGLGHVEVLGKHELSRRIASIKTVRIKEREFPYPHPNESEADPAAQSATTHHNHMSGTQPALIMPWHGGLPTVEVELNGMMSRRKAPGIDDR